MPTLYSTVNETGNRNRILERCKFRFRFALDKPAFDRTQLCLLEGLSNALDRQLPKKNLRKMTNDAERKLPVKLVILCTSLSAVLLRLTRSFATRYTIDLSTPRGKGVGQHFPAPLSPPKPTPQTRPVRRTNGHVAYLSDGDARRSQSTD